MKGDRQVQSLSRGKSGVAVKAGRQKNPRASRASGQGRTSVHPMLQLQQTIGNRAVRRLVRSCPAFPSRCPFGGACHLCPVATQSRTAGGHHGGQ